MDVKRVDSYGVVIGVLGRMDFLKALEPKYSMHGNLFAEVKDRMVKTGYKG